VFSDEQKMKSVKHRLFGPAALLITSLAALSTHAESGIEATNNPFQSIVASNIFRLRPIPPPDPKPVESAPITMLAKVVLTGIQTMLGPPQALLEITETEPARQPSTKTPILREGQHQGTVEVLSIDVEKNLVRIRNGTVETNLTFDPLKQSASPAVATTPPPPPALDQSPRGRAIRAIVPPAPTTGG
jgi:hypothetical protein